MNATKRALCAVLVLSLAACRKKDARGTVPLRDAEADTGAAAASVAASASVAPPDSSFEPAPLPPSLFQDYESICGAGAPVADVADKPAVPTGAAPKPPVLPTAAEVLFRSESLTKMERGDDGKSYVTRPFLGHFAVRAHTFDRVTFRAGWEDPVDCCTTKTKDERHAGLSFTCSFSGVDAIEGHGSARKDGDTIVLEWCSADLSTKTVLLRDRVTLPLRPGAKVTFATTVRACKE